LYGFELPCMGPHGGRRDEAAHRLPPEPATRRESRIAAPCCEFLIEIAHDEVAYSSHSRMLSSQIAGIRSVPRSPPAFAVQRGNRINQRQGFLRVVPVRAGQANRERHAPPVADQMTLAPALGPIGGIWTGLVTPRIG